MHRIVSRFESNATSANRLARVAALALVLTLVNDALRTCAAQDGAPVAVAAPAMAAPNPLPTGLTAQPMVRAALIPTTTPTTVQAVAPTQPMPTALSTVVSPSSELPPLAFVPAAVPTAAMAAGSTALPPLYPAPSDGPLTVRHASLIATHASAGPEALTVSAMSTPVVQPVSVKLHKDSLGQGLRTNSANASSGSGPIVAGGGPCDPITQVARPPQLCGRCCTPDPCEMDDCYCGTIRTHALHDLFGCSQFVVSSGVYIPSAGGVLGDRLLTGWGMDFAIRSPILPPLPNRRWFGEIGASFIQNGGKGSAITTSGTFVDANGLVPASFPLDELFHTQIRDIRRAAFTTGLGMTILPSWLNQTNCRLVSIVPRFGIRWGGTRLSYHHEPTDDLNAVIASRPILNDPDNFQYFSDAKKTDTFFGIYSSIGVQSTWCHVPIGCLCVRELTLGAQLQYVNDWIELGVLTGGHQKTISTVSPMLTLAVGF